MLDEFAGKRSMVQSLLGALKKSAGDELANGIGGDSKKKQVTHTPVPTESVAEHTHNKESYKPGAAERKDPKPSTADLNTGEQQTPEMEKPALMNDGGMAAPNDEPQRETPADTEEAEGGEDPKEEMSEGPIEEEDEDNNSSAFSKFLRKKKK